MKHFAEKYGVCFYPETLDVAINSYKHCDLSCKAEIDWKIVIVYFIVHKQISVGFDSDFPIFCKFAFKIEQTAA